MKRQRREQQPSATPRNNLSVDVVQNGISLLLVSGAAAKYPMTLAVLPGAEVSESAVFSPFTCEAMMSVLDTNEAWH